MVNETDSFVEGDGVKREDIGIGDDEEALRGIMRVFEISRSIDYFIRLGILLEHHSSTLHIPCTRH